MGEPAKRDSNKDTSQQTSSSENDFLSNILAPGSSLNPNFLLVVDGVLALLALTLLSLVIVTGGNVHLIALLFIELALWVSIKWFVRELQQTAVAQDPSNTSQDTGSETKKKVSMIIPPYSESRGSSRQREREREGTPGWVIISSAYP